VVRVYGEAAVKAGPTGLPAVVGLILIAAASWASVGDGRVPFERIPSPTQERVRDVTDHAVFERTVKGLTFRSREPVYLYFLEHPDVAAAVARAFKVAQYRVEQRSMGAYWGDDARGVKGLLEIVYADARKRVVYAQGTYDTKWLPTIYGRIVLVLEFEHRTNTDGHSYVTNDVTGYLRVDNAFLDVLARLVGPIVVGAVDRKVVRSVGIAAKVSERAYDDPKGFLQVLQESPEIDREHVAALSALLGRPVGSHSGGSAR
jgi:hypothetical protein